MAFTARSRSTEDALDRAVHLHWLLCGMSFSMLPIIIQTSYRCSNHLLFVLFLPLSPSPPLHLLCLFSSKPSHHRPCLSLPFFYDLPPFSFSNANFLLSSSVSLSLFLSQTCWSAAAVTSLATVLHSDWTLGHVARQQQ